MRGVVRVTLAVPIALCALGEGTKRAIIPPEMQA
jgi:hypothetical protein